VDVVGSAMASSIRLFVRLVIQSMEPGENIDVSWGEKRECDFESEVVPLNFEDVAKRIEAIAEGLYRTQTGGAESIQMQVQSIRSSSNELLPWADHVKERLTTGDLIMVHALAITESAVTRMNQGDSLQRRVKNLKGSLRFDLNDRVLCYCGPRWFSGSVVGTAVADEEDDSIIPYLVKTNPVPGVASRTISVPSDNDNICTQEVCFDPCSELHLIKAAAVLIPESRKPRTRFAVGERVVCRVRNSTDDGLERWVPGTVSEVWSELAGEQMWKFYGVSGNFPRIVPFKVDLDSGSWIYCHRDDHTLIRREGMEPQTRVRGISKRMELRKAKDGSKERIDHATERRKRMRESESSSSSND